MPSRNDTSSASTGNERSTIDSVDGLYMEKALRLSWQAVGQTDPNPLVGAVIVKDGAVVGEGYHHRCGEAHAEVVALEQAGLRARGATLYVTLEPCSHHGRTPPCTDRIVEGGIRRVVIPTLDPDDKVLGNGVDQLAGAGIRVDVGCKETAAIATNLGYYKQRMGLGSTVILKLATTLDGMIASAPGRRDDVTGERARRFAHRLRAASDGIVVGLGTVRADDPLLDCRLVDCGTPPVPVVFDGSLDLPQSNRWSRQQKPFVVVAGRGADEYRKACLEARGGRVIQCASDGRERVDVIEAVEGLAAAGLGRLLVEGGAELFTSFVRAGAWDAMYLFHSLKAFGEGGVSAVAGIESLTPDAVAVDSIRLDGDFLHRYLNRETYDQIRSRLQRRDVAPGG
jgi:diaminohydroxyphosphoribosylaminopyrimidine deaminase/5-amino-6-(5-phosphoribosylamino)uracil reductase